MRIAGHESALRIERLDDSLNFMTKRVIDLTAEELDALAREAWSAAAEAALAQKLAISGSQDGQRVRYFPNGRSEDLGAVAPLPGQEAGFLAKKEPRKSVA